VAASDLQMSVNLAMTINILPIYNLSVGQHILANRCCIVQGVGVGKV